MLDYDDFFDGSGRRNKVNLSTNTASSSSSLLSTVKKERLAREQRRRDERAALIIQKVWRGKRAALDIRQDTISSLGEGSVAKRAGRLVGLYKVGVWADGDKVRAALGEWVDSAGRVDGTEPAFLEVLKEDRGYPGAITIGILLSQVIKAVSEAPATVTSAKLLAFTELVLDQKSYSTLGAEGREDLSTIVAVIVGRRWIENLSIAIEKLIAASLPKKKHPHLQPITRLLTAPFDLSSSTTTDALIPPLLNHLLAIPALPQSLPIPSLTHLSQRLPLFTSLLPAAAADPTLLSQGRLSTELGRTYFLANITTFGITGGMLAKYGVEGANTWVQVIATLLSGVQEGWGKWAEGVVEPESESEDEPMDIDSDTENGSPTKPLVITTKQRKLRRTPLPKNVSSKLLLLGSSSHISTLADLLVSSQGALSEFANFTLGLLTAFKGSPRWEAILDGLLEGRRGVALARRMWREGVRGKWGIDRDQSSWQNFTSNPSMPCLILMTHLYCHYLLLTPDDEFFAQTNRTNPLSSDEILELGAIWRDLAFWGYMLGVSPNSDYTRVGDEDTRALFTKGVTRMAARKKFAPDDYWVMSSQMDLQGFVEAAVLEDMELAQTEVFNGGDDGSHILTSTNLPSRMQARQWYTKRQLARLSPRLGLLNNLPMAVPFRTRLEVFRQFVAADRMGSRDDRYSHNQRSCRATIRRETLAEDGFRQLNNEGPRLRGRIQITFIDQFGQEESGIDGGGLFKEFLTSLSKEAFDTNRGLWLVTDENQLYPNPHSYAKEAHQLSWFGFLGRILGKALYDGILVDVSFARFFLAKWLGRSSYLDDLASLDSSLYNGLTKLKSLPDAEIENLSLSFTVTEQEFGVARSIDLIPGGSDIAVTAENRQEYIQLMCKYKLDKQIAAQSRAFFHGLSDLIDSKWLRMFDQAELAQLIGGEDKLIDMDDLEKFAHVSGYANDRTITAFWKVVKSFNQEQRRGLVKFVTSCARPPLLGFAHLNPQFGIRFGGNDKTRLPSASSCANLLKLPDYQDEALLREKLLQSIDSGAGFDLS